MALSMVHLLVAEKWAQAHPEFLESPEFFFGAIAPDAYHVRFGNDKSRKDEYHLYNWVSPHPDEVAAYWQEHRSAFDVGFGVHVLTDGQWVPRFRSRLKGMLLPNGLLNTDIYYNDTFVTDFYLRDNMPWSKKVFDMIAEAEIPDDHPLLTRGEFSEWREDILRTYAGACPKNDPVQFVDTEYVFSFAHDSIELIENTYRSAFV